MYFFIFNIQTKLTFMPQVIETQIEKNCTIHAINNALQERLVTVKDGDDDLLKRFHNYNKKRLEKGLSALNKKKFMHDFKGNGYSIDYFFEKLKQNGYFISHVPIDHVSIENLKIGSWVILGSYPEFAHALAIRDGFIIESLGSGILIQISGKKVKWPSGFSPKSFFTFSRVPKILETSENVIEID